MKCVPISKPCQVAIGALLSIKLAPAWVRDLCSCSTREECLLACLVGLHGF